jgi:adenylate cyclase
MVFTALGDAVNVASRLQDMTKTLGCQVIISDDVYARARLASGALAQQEVEIRGRAEPMRVRTAMDATDLAMSADEGPAA